MPKPTIADISRLAGVSQATVDRALNQRRGVNVVTKERVFEAADSLGYRYLPRNPMTVPRHTSFRVIFPQGCGWFTQSLKGSLVRHCESQSLPRNCLSFSATRLSPDAVVKAIERAVSEEVDAIALFAINAPEVRAAINRAVHAGVLVVTLVADVPGSDRHAFVGIDNLAAGRTAARLLGGLAHRNGGDVAVLVGQMQNKDHCDRYFGFRELISKEFRALKIIPVKETRSSEYETQVFIEELIQRGTKLAGVYVTTGGVLGVTDALSSANKTDVVVVAHDLTSTTRRLLVHRQISALVCQDPSRIAYSAVQLMSDAIHADGVQEIPDNTTIPIEIFVPENLS